METAEIRISGKIDPVAFAEFVGYYSTRLDIVGNCTMASADALTIIVKGRRALVEMLATACALGPARSLVKDIQIDHGTSETVIAKPAKGRAKDTY